MKAVARLSAALALSLIAGGAAKAGGFPATWGGGQHKAGAMPKPLPQPAQVPGHGGGSTQVPEPGDVFLFAAGVAGLIIGRRSSRMKPRA